MDNGTVCTAIRVYLVPLNCPRNIVSLSIYCKDNNRELYQSHPSSNHYNADWWLPRAVHVWVDYLTSQIALSLPHLAALRTQKEKNNTENPAPCSNDPKSKCSVLTEMWMWFLMTRPCMKSLHWSIKNLSVHWLQAQPGCSGTLSGFWWLGCFAGRANLISIC